MSGTTRSEDQGSGRRTHFNTQTDDDINKSRERKGTPPRQLEVDFLPSFLSSFVKYPNSREDAFADVAVLYCNTPRLMTAMTQ